MGNHLGEVVVSPLHSDPKSFTNYLGKGVVMKSQFEESSSEPLQITRSSHTFRYWIANARVSDQTRSRLEAANVLLIPDIRKVPEENETIFCFPHETAELFRYLEANRPDSLSIDACIEDSDYIELALHADWLLIAGVIASHFIAPLVVNLISNYIEGRLGDRGDKTLVKAELTVVIEEGKQSFKFAYSGPARDYRDIMTRGLASLDSLSLDELELPSSEEPVAIEQPKSRSPKKDVKKRKK